MMGDNPFLSLYRWPFSLAKRIGFQHIFKASGKRVETKNYASLIRFESFIGRLLSSQFV